MNLRPLNDLVILRRQEKTETSEGGILLPGRAAEASVYGEVLAVGPGRVLDNGERSRMDVNVGDVVMFDADYARPSKVDGEEVLIVAAENLIATVG
jgi:chaperonin GroES